MKRKFFSAAILFATVLISSPAIAADFELKKGDHICLVGNALCERMQHHNYWESLLQQRFPELQLSVRNLGFPGDEPYERIRSENFGDPDKHLGHSKASVVMYFFGFNESFDGDAGLAKFSSEMKKLIQETQAKDYGNGQPQVVVVSPIAFENTGDPNLPTGEEHNARLAKYTQALATVAKETGANFADIFHPTLALFKGSKKRLTLNGAHLNDVGYSELAPILDAALFGDGGPNAVDPLVKAAVDDKSFHWWHRYRAVNGFSIYGARGKAGSDGTYNNTDVMERERTILDQMTANRDARIWACLLYTSPSPRD